MKMDYSFFITPEAGNDIKEGKEWYKNTGVSGLADKYIKDIKRAIKRACQNPFAFAVIYDNVRLVLPEIFPYPIHFYINEDKKHIVIIAVIFEGRNPDYIRNRTK